MFTAQLGKASVAYGQKFLKLSISTSALVGTSKSRHIAQSSEKTDGWNRAGYSLQRGASVGFGIGGRSGGRLTEVWGGGFW